MKYFEHAPGLLQQRSSILAAWGREYLFIYLLFRRVYLVFHGSVLTGVDNKNVPSHLQIKPFCAALWQKKNMALGIGDILLNSGKLAFRGWALGILCYKVRAACRGAVTPEHVPEMP